VKPRHLWRGAVTFVIKIEMKTKKEKRKVLVSNVGELTNYKNGCLLRFLTGGIESLTPIGPLKFFLR
jgi:hypothetical protein